MLCLCFAVVCACDLLLLLSLLLKVKLSKVLGRQPYVLNTMSSKTSKEVYMNMEETNVSAYLDVTMLWCSDIPQKFFQPF